MARSPRSNSAVWLAGWLSLWSPACDPESRDLSSPVDGDPTGNRPEQGSDAGTTSGDEPIPTPAEPSTPEPGPGEAPTTPAPPSNGPSGIFTTQNPPGSATAPAVDPEPSATAEPEDAGSIAPAPSEPTPSEPEPSLAPVSGKVIDFWQHPVPNVPLSIGEATTTTDADGEFTLDAVPAEYDVQLVVSWESAPAGTFGWRFEGLTRRDPTLQVYRALENNSATVVTTLRGAMGTSTTPVAISFGGRDGATAHRVTSASELSTWWEGPSTTNATAHALFWETSDALPIAYRGYTSKLIALESGNRTELELELAADAALGSGTLGGEVSSSMSNERRNRVHLRFADGAAMELVDEAVETDAFTYAIPTLPETTVIVSASTGFDSPFEGYAVAHVDGVTAGTLNVAIAVPELPLLQEPPQGVMGVDASTPFRWEGDAPTYVWYAEDSDYEQGVFVVTSAREVTLPSFTALGFDLRRNAPHLWAVEVHGSYPSMDELAGPTGFLDAFSHTYDRPLGPRRGTGSFAASVGFGFTTAP